MPKSKNAITKELSACVEERFNAFQFVKGFAENERRPFYRPIDIA